MNPEIRLERMLQQHGFVLRRTNKHRIYRNHEGKVLVVSATPGDFRAIKNSISDLNRVLSSPATPEVLAIADFERAEAVRLLAGEQKHTAHRNGSHRKSNGTGFHYENRNERMADPATAARAI